MTRNTSLSCLLLISLCIFLVHTNPSLPKRRILISHHDEHHLDADDHDHAVEIHACSGVALELQGDADLEAVNIDNGREFLLTDVELTSCDEIDHLTCKPEAKICQKWSAHEDHHVSLHHRDFGTMEAHFYAMPEDHSRSVSVKLKLHPTGYQDQNVHHDHHDSHSGHKQGHVDEDGHYHALELHECSGTTLQIPNEDVIVDAVQVNNGHRYLITDKELDSCDEIKHLQCKSDAHFCHVVDFDSNEMVLLHHGDFHNNEAFFYVEAINPNEPVDVNIKITPGTHDDHGTHENDPTGTHEINTGDHNGGHETKHIDDDGHTHALELHACSGTALELHVDSHLSAHNIYNAKRYLVTNLEKQTCEEIKHFSCEANATFCHVWNADSNEEILLTHDHFPTGEAYFYAEPKDEHEEISLNVKLAPVDAAHADDATAHHSGTEVNHVEVDGHHHALEIHSCSGTILKMKGNITVLSIENVFNADKYMISDTELVTCEEILKFDCPDGSEMCHIWDAATQHDLELHSEDFPHHEAYLYVKPQAPKFSVSVNAELETLEEYTHKKVHNASLIDTHDFKIHKWEHGLVLIALLSFLTLCGLSCYYRRYVNKHKQAPFRPPFWCPNFIFPDQSAVEAERFIPL